MGAPHTTVLTRKTCLDVESPPPSVPSGNFHLLYYVSFTGCSGYLLQHGLCHGAHPSPPSSLTLVPAELFHIFFTHSPLSQFMCSVFCPYLKCVFHEVSPPWLMSSAVSCSESIVAGWNHFCLAWGSPWLPVTEATLSAPQYQDLDTYNQCICVSNLLANISFILSLSTYTVHGDMKGVLRFCRQPQQI